MTCLRDWERYFKLSHFKTELIVVSSVPYNLYWPSDLRTSTLLYPWDVTPSSEVDASVLHLIFNYSSPLPFLHPPLQPPATSNWVSFLSHKYLSVSFLLHVHYYCSMLYLPLPGLSPFHSVPHRLCHMKTSMTLTNFKVMFITLIVPQPRPKPLYFWS